MDKASYRMCFGWTISICLPVECVILLKSCIFNKLVKNSENVMHFICINSLLQKQYKLETKCNSNMTNTYFTMDEIISRLLSDVIALK